MREKSGINSSNNNKRKKNTKIMKIPTNKRNKNVHAHCTTATAALHSQLKITWLYTLFHHKNFIFWFVCSSFFFLTVFCRLWHSHNRIKRSQKRRRAKQSFQILNTTEYPNMYTNIQSSIIFIKMKTKMLFGASNPHRFVRNVHK